MITCVEMYYRIKNGNMTLEELIKAFADSVNNGYELGYMTAYDEGYTDGYDAADTEIDMEIE